MKKIFIIFGIVSFASLFGRAQDEVGTGVQGEKLKALEIAYITKQLNLTPEEAEKFWPVFNKYREEVKGVLTDKSISDDLERQQRVLDIRKKYRADFARILNPERAQQVYGSEDRFRNMLKREWLQRLRERQEAKPPRNNRGY